MHIFDYNLPLFQISKIHLPTGLAQGVPTFGFFDNFGHGVVVCTAYL